MGARRQLARRRGGGAKMRAWGSAAVCTFAAELSSARESEPSPSFLYLSPARAACAFCRGSLLKLPLPHALRAPASVKRATSSLPSPARLSCCRLQWRPPLLTPPLPAPSPLLAALQPRPASSRACRPAPCVLLAAAPLVRQPAASASRPHVLPPSHQLPNLHYCTCFSTGHRYGPRRCTAGRRTATLPSRLAKPVLAHPENE